MANNHLLDRVAETSTSTGTGAFTLSGVAKRAHFTWASQVSNGDTVCYCIEDIPNNAIELGIGTYSAGVLTRTTVQRSSNSNALVSFAAGTKNVYCTASVKLQADGELLIGRTGSGPTPALITGGSGISVTPGAGTLALAGAPFVASGALHAIGMVPDPGSIAGIARFLREDATWAPAVRKLSSALTLYVSPSGSDSNDGLSSLTPFLTIQKAINTAQSLDASGFANTIQLANGTYNESIVLGAFSGTGSWNIQGNLGNPRAVQITGQSILAVSVLFSRMSDWRLTSLKIQPASGGYGIQNAFLSSLTLNNCVFGATTAYLTTCHGFSQTIMNGNIQLDGDAICFMLSQLQGHVNAQSMTVTFTNNPTHISYYTISNYQSLITHAGVTWVNKAFCVGSQYIAQYGSGILTGGLTLPGTTPGILGPVSWVT